MKFFFEIKWNVYLDTLIRETYFLLIKFNVFRGDLSDISAKTATLVSSRAEPTVYSRAICDLYSDFTYLHNSSPRSHSFYFFSDWSEQPRILTAEKNLKKNLEYRLYKLVVLKEQPNAGNTFRQEETASLRYQLEYSLDKLFVQGLVSESYIFARVFDVTSGFV